ncbi:MAG TPA: TetR/AcrR family transcriptional regulator [Terriglobia bacterium]|nr:TetR/AcrR family transcriptional regulator [Terriglobia bacterium]
MSPRRANPELAERRREALIKAGYAEILEKGIPSTTIDSVVERAGTSKGGALYYFRTKDDLLYAVFHWLLSQLDRTLAEVTQAARSPRARLAAELELLFHSAEVNRKLYKVLFEFVALSLHSERFRTLLNSFFAKWRERDMEIIADGIHQEQFRHVRPEDVAITLRALVDGYCLQWIMSEPESNLDEYRDRCRAVLGSYLLR